MRLRIATAVLNVMAMVAVPLSCGLAQETPAPKETKPVTAVAKSPKAEPLSEKEQSDLAKRAEEPGAEVAGGALSNLHLTYIVIALAAAVVVLVLK